MQRQQRPQSVKWLGGWLSVASLLIIGVRVCLVAVAWSQVIAMANLDYKIEIECVCEIDPAVRQMLKTTLDSLGHEAQRFEWDMVSRPPCQNSDVYFASTPCQSFSTCGAGQDDVLAPKTIALT